eukprot:gene8092-biopygen3102
MSYRGYHKMDMGAVQGQWVHGLGVWLFFPRQPACVSYTRLLWDGVVCSTSAGEGLEDDEEQQQEATQSSPEHPARKKGTAEDAPGTCPRRVCFFNFYRAGRVRDTFRARPLLFLPDERVAVQSRQEQRGAVRSTTEHPGA